MRDASFLTGGAVLVSAVGENRLQLCETRPGLHFAVEAFQVVQVNGWTEDKDTNTDSGPQCRVWFCPSLKQTSIRTYIKCVFSPRVCVAEVRPEF